MNNNDRSDLRGIAAQLFKLAEGMDVNVQPTRMQCAALRELAQRLLDLANAKFGDGS